MSESNMKTLLTVFFDSKDTVHHEYAPSGQIINKEYYWDALCHLDDAVHEKRTELHAFIKW